MSFKKLNAFLANVMVSPCLVPLSVSFLAVIPCPVQVQVPKVQILSAGYKLRAALTHTKLSEEKQTKTPGLA